MRARSWIAFVVVAGLGCGAPEPSPVLLDPPDDPASSIDERASEALLRVAERYERWGRIDDEARWAPWLCRLPRPARARVSDAPDETPHGRKVYTLYAQDAEAYGAVGGVEEKLEPLPFQQVVVKEAWRPLPVPQDQQRDASGSGWGRSRLLPVAGDDGQLYGADEREGLYVMLQLPEGADVAGTDAGWIYGTLVPEKGGWRVTAGGRITSCMECHVEATGPGGRLFGLPEEERLAAPADNPR